MNTYETIQKALYPIRRAYWDWIDYIVLPAIKSIIMAINKALRRLL